MPFNPVDPNQSLQATAGSCGFINVFGVVAGFGLSDVFRRLAKAFSIGVTQLIGEDTRRPTPRALVRA